VLRTQYLLHPGLVCARKPVAYHISWVEPELSLLRGGYITDDTPCGSQITHQLRVESRFLPDRAKRARRRKRRVPAGCRPTCTMDLLELLQARNSIFHLGGLF